MQSRPVIDEHADGPLINSYGGSQSEVLLREAIPDGGKLRLWVAELLEFVLSTPVPVTAVIVIALDLVQYRVQPVGGRITRKSLRCLVCRLPIAGDCEVSGVD